MQVQMHAVRRLAQMRVVELRLAAATESDAQIVVALVEDIEPRFAGQRERSKLRTAEPRQIERPADLRLVFRRFLQCERRRITLALPFPGGRVFELPLFTLLERLWGIE